MFFLSVYQTGIFLGICEVLVAYSAAFIGNFLDEISQQQTILTFLS
jgi:hypothetical protein